MVLAGGVALAGSLGGVTAVHGVIVDQPFVDSITYGGSGCTADSAGISIASTRDALTMIFDSFIVSSGPGVPLSAAQRLCELTLQLSLPAGSSSSACVESTVRGFEQLADGVGFDVTRAASWYTQSKQAVLQSVAGPRVTDYVAFDSLSLAYSESTPTIRTVRVTLGALLGAPADAAASATIDSIDMQILDSPDCISGEVVQPTLNGAVDPQPNGNGWNNGDVTVTWTCTDSESGVDAQASSLADDVITESGTADAECVDVAGNRTTSTVDVQIDRDAPEISVLIPQEGAELELGSDVGSNFDCIDAVSGVVQCVAPASIDTSTLGTHYFIVLAEDAAGNITTHTATYTVTAPLSPTAKQDCLRGRWRQYTAPAFRTQGACITWVIRS